jgi:hypothetical protein
MKSKSAETVFERKHERRRQLAKLPFEKKIEIIVEMQKAAAGIHEDSRREIWPIEPDQKSGLNDRA